MLLDQISAMENPFGDSGNSQLNGIASKIGTLHGTVGDFSSDFKSFASSELHFASSAMSYFQDDLRLSTGRNTFLSKIDNSIRSQTSNVISRIDSSAQLISRKIDSLASLGRNLLTSVSRTQQRTNAQVEPFYDALDSSFEDTISGVSVEMSRVRGSIDTLGSSFNIYHDDFKRSQQEISSLLRGVRSSLDSLPALISQGFLGNASGSQSRRSRSDSSQSSTSRNTGGSENIRQSILDSIHRAEQERDAQQQGATPNRESVGEHLLNSIRRRMGLNDTAAGRLVGPAMLFNGIKSIFSSSMADLDENFKSMQDKLAKSTTVKASEAFSARRDIYEYGAERNAASGRLGNASKLIPVEQYDEALNTVLDQGASDLREIAEGTAESALAKNLLPDLTIESEEYFKDLIKGYEDGSDRIRGITMDIKAYSENMWVTPSTLQEAVSANHDAVNAMTSDLDSYMDKMDKFVRAKARLSDAGLDLGIEETVDTIGFSAVSDWADTGKLQQLRFLGLDPNEIEDLAWDDPEAAYEKMAEGVRNRFGKFFDENGNITKDQGQRRQFKEMAKQAGFTSPEQIKELMGSVGSGGAIENFEKNGDTADLGKNLKTSGGISDAASQALSDENQLTWAEEFKNIVDWETNVGAISHIEEILNNAGFTSGQVSSGIGAILSLPWKNIGGAVMSLGEGGSAAQVLGHLFEGDGEAYTNMINRFREMGGTRGVMSNLRNAGNRLADTARRINGRLPAGAQRMFSRAGNLVSRGASNFSRILTRAGTGSGNVLTSVISRFAGTFPRASSALGNFASRALPRVTSGLSRFAGGATQLASKMGATGVLSAGAALLDGVSSMKKTKDWFGDESAGHKAASFVGGVLGGSGEGIMGKGSVLEKAMDIGGGALKGAGIGAMVAGPVGAAVGAAIGGVGSAIGGKKIAQMVASVGDKAKDLNTKIDGVLEDKLGRAGKALVAIKNGKLKSYGKLFGGVLDVTGDLTTGAVDGVKNIFGGLKDGLGQIITGHPIKGITSVVGGIVKGVWSAISGIGKGLWDVVKGIGGFFKEKIAGWWKGLKALLGFGDKEKEAEKEVKKGKKKETDKDEDEVKVHPFVDLTKPEDTKPIDLKGGAFFDPEAERPDSLYTPSKNLANYDNITDTSQIKQGYTNEDALLEGKLSVDNDFADSVKNGTYGDLSEYLTYPDEEHMGLDKYKSLDQAQSAVNIKNKKKVKVKSNDLKKFSKSAQEAGFDKDEQKELSKAVSSKDKIEEYEANANRIKIPKSIKGGLLGGMLLGPMGVAAGAIAGHISSDMENNPDSKYNQGLTRVASIFGFGEKGEESAEGIRQKQGASNKPRSIFSFGRDKREDSEPQDIGTEDLPDNPIVAALQTFQDNVIMRLDRILGANTPDLPKTVPNYSADPISSINDQDIRNYAK